MASVAEGANGNEFYWINDNEEPPVDPFRGMSRNIALKFGSASNVEGKIRKRPSSMEKSGKKPGLHLTMQSAEMAVQKLPSTEAKSKTTTSASEPDLPLATSAQPLSSAAQAKSKPSLKDLCPEDKRRIANLIQELARVSEEKEESVQKLKDEQETFEKRIQQLEQQNQLIIEERGSLQQQYRECQELLGLYQQYLSQQQEKLNKSITLLNQSCSHSKVPSSEGGPRRSCDGRGTALDGSYLELRSLGSRTERGGSVECTHSFSTGPLSAHSSIKQNCEVHDRCTSHDCESACCDPSFSNREPSACDGLKLRGASTLKCSHQCHCHKMENGGMHKANQSRVVPPSGQENWEEKRRCLLMQKKQLEMERERIQARLAQQEEKLLHQNQQLHQSYLQYSKLQQATTTDFEKGLNGDSSFNKGPQSSFVMDQVTHSNEIKDGESHTLQESVPQPLSNIQEHTSGIEQPAPKLSKEISITKKDMATSPVVPQSFHTSAHPKIPVGLPSTPQASRLDDSLIELLDIFSPVSNPETYRIKPSSRNAFIAPPSSNKTLRSPFGPSRSALQDLEESEILEDIFFIC
ncbi:protein hinderin isoform X2 [Danio aesculapii]|uniref:protein hinderin isoform X2 n=1 Tax=Danio aesculapii TaxID=1142201 RepID=UPI0024C06A02|nr:protein hinderin isoform X2 [Danio aesculapii]